MKNVPSTSLLFVYLDICLKDATHRRYIKEARVSHFEACYSELVLVVNFLKQSVSFIATYFYLLRAHEVTVKGVVVRIAADPVHMTEPTIVVVLAIAARVVSIIVVIALVLLQDAVVSIFYTIVKAIKDAFAAFLVRGDPNWVASINNGHYNEQN